MQRASKTLEGMKILSHLEIKRQDGSKKYEDPTVRLKTNQPPQLFDTARMPFNGNIGNGSTLRGQSFYQELGDGWQEKDSPPTSTRG